MRPMRPVINLLLRLYPAPWRARYGDEFAAVLEERPLGPFDVADVLLGALDAHLHLRGLGAASQHAKGFAMSLRIGGYAAIVGGILWFLALAGNAINDGRENGVPFLGLAVVLAMAATLVALVGLSAFQARRHPVLTWAAFAIPAVGAVVGLLGWLSTVVVGDGQLPGGLSPWMVGSLGLLMMILGSSLFAIATWRTRSLSRGASALLAVGAVLVIVTLLGVGSGGLSLPGALVPIIAAIVVFPAGWIALGMSALRISGPAPDLEGAVS
jgi:drug/metabolite transporter (DMT)-like permease